LICAGAVVGRGVGGNATLQRDSDFQAQLYTSTWHTLVSQSTEGVTVSFCVHFIQLPNPLSGCLSDCDCEDYSRDIFHVEGFSLQRLQIEELFIVMVSFYAFPTSNIFDFFVNFSFF